MGEHGTYVPTIWLICMQFFFFVDRIPPHTVAISGTTETGGPCVTNMPTVALGGGYAGYIGLDRSP